MLAAIVSFLLARMDLLRSIAAIERSIARCMGSNSSGLATYGFIARFLIW